MKKGNVCFLIDDDYDDQEIFSVALKKVDPSGTCISASSGLEALQKLTNGHIPVPDYIFLDLNMPRMNGRECLKEIKKLDHLKDIPVVIYSTSSLKNDIIETYTLGAADFIVKPFNMAGLIDELNRFFERRSMLFGRSVTIEKEVQ